MFSLRDFKKSITKGMLNIYFYTLVNGLTLIMYSLDMMEVKQPLDLCGTETFGGDFTIRNQ